MLTSKEKAIEIAKILDSKKGEDIRVLEIRELTSMCDYFIICSGGSSLHIKALCDNVEEQMKQKGITPEHNEGVASAAWLLMDYGDVVVHIFDHESASFYNLERLWADAPKLDIQF